jgi:hypothetical protein
MEVADMEVRVRKGVQDHGKIAIHLIRRRGPVMVCVFDVIGPDAQPSLREFQGVLETGWA